MAVTAHRSAVWPSGRPRSTNRLGDSKPAAIGTPARRKETDMQKCTVSFTTDNGREVHAGDIVSNDDPVIQGREDRFEPFEEDDAEALAATKGDPVAEEVSKDRVVHTQPVEEATANPGEKRQTKR